VLGLAPAAGVCKMQHGGTFSVYNARGHSGPNERFDRAAMIEAASRNLRQQMAKSRELPRSKGSPELLGSSPKAQGSARNESWHGRDRRGSAEQRGGEQQQSSETAQRRMRSAEGNHTRVPAGSQAQLHGGLQGEDALSPTAGATPGGEHPALVDQFPSGEIVEERSQSTTAGIESDGAVNLGDLKRPLSRKKDPSASAAAGLGAIASPARPLTDAFEHKKARQPIPVESWGPRPPSRHGSSTKSAPLGTEAGWDEESQMSSSSSRGRGGHCDGAEGGSGISGGTWAAARDKDDVKLQGSSRSSAADSRRGSGGDRGERKSSSGSFRPPEDLGIFGCSAGSPTNLRSNNMQQGMNGMGSPIHRASTGSAGIVEWAATKDLDGNPWQPQRDPGASRLSQASTADSGSFGLEVNGCGLGGGRPPPTRQGARTSGSGPTDGMGISVEDVDDELDSGLLNVSGIYRREATPPQVIVTRSSQQAREREASKGRRERGGRQQRPAPLFTSLEDDFLSLFAS